MIPLASTQPSCYYVPCLEKCNGNVNNVFTAAQFTPAPGGDPPLSALYLPPHHRRTTPSKAQDTFPAPSASSFLLACLDIICLKGYLGRLLYKAKVLVRVILECPALYFLVFLFFERCWSTFSAYSVETCVRAWSVTGEEKTSCCVRWGLLSQWPQSSKIAENNESNGGGHR